MLMYESHGASFDLIKSIKRVCGEISPHNDTPRESCGAI